MITSYKSYTVGIDQGQVSIIINKISSLVDLEKVWIMLLYFSKPGQTKLINGRTSFGERIIEEPLSYLSFTFTYKVISRQIVSRFD